MPPHTARLKGGLLKANEALTSLWGKSKLRQWSYEQH
jgi:hypothetical protein